MKAIDFHDLYRDGRHYDLQNKDFVADIPFWLKKIREYGEPVLELACGTGRITIPVAEEEIQITGLDVLESMLAHAKRKANEKRVQIEWVHADCRDFDLAKKFNLVFFPANSITHLHDLESLGACFSSVRRHLNRQGRFIIDVFNPRLDLLLRDPNKRYPVATYLDPDGKGIITVTENNIYDTVTQINRLKWYYRVGESEEETVIENNMRIIYPEELESLLYYNGFKIESKFGDYDETPLTSSSPKQLVVCYAT